MGSKGCKQDTTPKACTKNSELPSKAWLSNGVELLFERNGLNKDGEPFDAVIVGSGYGGSIAASELSQQGLSICLLERGREFLPGSFPTSMSEAPAEFRRSGSAGTKPRGNLEGLFDLRIGKDLNVMQANGLGGGSLINAGVMERANNSVFEKACWPSEITAKSLEQYYTEAEVLLGSKVLDKNQNPQPNTIHLHPLFSDTNSGPAKYKSLKKLAQSKPDGKHSSEGMEASQFRSASITVNMKQGQKTVAGMPLNLCNLCGDCASGCNNNAKISLDKNLLAVAANNGVEVFTGATVLEVQAAKRALSEKWLVKLVYTDPQLRSRQAQTALQLKTQNVILSAGTLGSTEILKRSQSPELLFSKMLGEKFSSNGDMIAVGFNQNQLANAIADPKTSHSKRGIGPTITGMIDLRGHPDPDQRMVIQEMAVPSAAKHFFGELYASVNTVQTLWSSDKTTHSQSSNFIDPAALNSDALERTSLYAIMGNDGAEGRLEIGTADSLEHEGTIQVTWPKLKEHPLFEKQIDRLKKLSTSGKDCLGGEILPNPIWQLLKPEHMNMMNVELGAPLTVHPLGGCPMGASAATGVVNYRGQVFKPSHTENSRETYKGLLVLDGAIIPEAVGINPALTISAVSLKSIRELVTEGYFQSAPSKQSSFRIEACPINLSEIPIVRSLEQLETLAESKEKQTEIQITERLIGFSQLENNNGVVKEVAIELTLWSKSTSTDTLSKKNKDSFINGITLEIDNSKRNEVTAQPLSKLRLYDKSDWDDIRSGKCKVDKHEVMLDTAAKFIGQVEGHLTIFERAESSPLSRIIKSGWGWLLNRGARDLYQALRPTPWETSTVTAPRREREKRNLVSRFLNLGRTLSRAGEIRTLNYNLTITDGIKVEDFSYFAPTKDSKTPTKPKKIVGIKHLTYRRRSNPWNQLSEVSLTQLPSKLDTAKKVKLKAVPPRLARPLSNQNTLALDMGYLAKTGIPLMRITQQQNQVNALMDISAFVAYMTRMLLGIHFYSFRAPDKPKPRQAVRLAGHVNGLPTPTVHRLSVGKIPDNRIDGLIDGQTVEIVLTHYQHKKATKAPVMMLHGYSDNSALFAHSSLPNSLTKVIHDNERDVWLVDLRTSSALASAKYPWTFETVSQIDIPRAVEHIYDYYQGKNKIDVITHCMGSVMLGMSILRPNKDLDKHKAPFFKTRINRIVFSQATPTVVFTADNNFKSFATNYLKEMIPVEYQFQVKKEEIANQILDRLLYTLPYPRQEFDIVNAPLKPRHRAEFARTRHRVDAFFSRTFELANLSAETLKHIDDFFGPIHVDTIVQASRFAHNNVATNINGSNKYVSRERLQKYWSGIPTMSFHSRSNGLVDLSTGERTKRVFTEAGVAYKSIIIKNESYGHQDSITGINAHLDVFPHIIDFLDEPNAKAVLSQKSLSAVDHKAWVVEPPNYGPIIIDSGEKRKVKIMLGSNAARACTPLCIFIPVCFVENRLQLVGQTQADQTTVLEHYVEQSLTLRDTKKEGDRSPWHVIDIPKSLLTTPNVITNTQMDGLAALMIYDDLIELEDNFVIGAEPQEHNATHAGSVYTRIENDRELQSVVLNVVANFFQSDRNVLNEFSKSVIEYKYESSDDGGFASKNNKLCFALGSCQYPAGMLDKEVAYDSYRQLRQLLKSKLPNKPQFITLIGDQIYADATAGFLDPTAKFDRFVQPYYRLYENQHVRSVLRALPLFAMLDDHELSDNWEPVTNNPAKQIELDETRTAGVESFLKFQRGEVVDSNTKKLDAKHNSTPLWYSFVNNGHDFFMLDTRTDRSARTAATILHSDTTIISSTQQQAFERWLINLPNEKPKFVLSSSILLPRHNMNHASQNSAANCIRSDGWDGYPVSLHNMLALVVDQQVEQLVFLSGDEHIGCYAEIEIHNLSTGKSAYAVSAHCPGLYTPFPFANARADDFEGHLDNTTGRSVSQFEFQQNGSTYQCQVQADFNLASETIQLGPIKIELCGGFLIINAT